MQENHFLSALPCTLDHNVNHVVSCSCSSIAQYDAKFNLTFDAIITMSVSGFIDPNRLKVLFGCFYNSYVKFCHQKFGKQVLVSLPMDIYRLR